MDETEIQEKLNDIEERLEYFERLNILPEILTYIPKGANRRLNIGFLAPGTNVKGTKSVQILSANSSVLTWSFIDGIWHTSA